MEFVLKPHRLRDLVAEIGGELEPLLRAKNLAFEIRDDGCGDVAMLDSTRMGQVVRNLLTNALKFTPGGGTIEASIIVLQNPHVLPFAARALALRLDDDGVGILEDELATIFDKFVQSSKTRHQGGGTGLGLAICREIVTGHGGWIGASNRERGGARFELALPYTASHGFSDVR